MTQDAAGTEAESGAMPDGLSAVQLDREIAKHAGDSEAPAEHPEPHRHMDRIRRTCDQPFAQSGPVSRHSRDTVRAARISIL